MPSLPAIPITDISPVQQRNDTLAGQYSSGPMTLAPRHIKQLRQYTLKWVGLTTYNKNQLEFFITNTVRYNILPFNFTHPHGQLIIGATNTTPITITLFFEHFFVDNDQITITGVEGNTNTNGTWEITGVTGTTCILRNSVGNGTFTDTNSNALAQLYLPRVTCEKSQDEFVTIEKILGPDTDANGIFTVEITIQELF
jgi:hypothetical protein